MHTFGSDDKIAVFEPRKEGLRFYFLFMAVWRAITHNLLVNSLSFPPF
jgi:hypothetical protein